MIAAVIQGGLRGRLQLPSGYLGHGISLDFPQATTCNREPALRAAGQPLTLRVARAGPPGFALGLRRPVACQRGGRFLTMRPPFQDVEERAVRNVAPPLAALWALLGVTFAALAGEPASKVRIEQAWARATPPGVPVGAAYAVIRNGGAADRLTAVESTVSERVEIHQTSHQDDRMQMRPMATLDIPASGQVAFEPGGLHLMLVALKQPLSEDAPLSMTFVFEKAGRVTVQVPVAPIGSLQAPANDSHHEHHH